MNTTFVFEYLKSERYEALDSTPGLMFAYTFLIERKRRSL